MSCKDNLSSLRQEVIDQEVEEVLEQMGARTDMAIDSEMNLFMYFGQYLPAEPGEIIGATVELEAYTNIELGEPDANGISSPLAHSGEMPVGKWLRVNLKNRYGDLCKVVINKKVFPDIIYKLNNWEGIEGIEGIEGAEGYSKDAFLYTSGFFAAKEGTEEGDDGTRLCYDDKIVPLRVLNAAMGDFGVGGMLPEKELQDRVHAYKNKQQKFLGDNAKRDDVQEFMLRSQMLDGHFALRNALGGNQEGTVISSVLGAFVSDRHNMMPSEEILKEEDSLALQTTKVAIAGVVSRFLMYQEVFNAAEFAVEKFNDDFNKIAWHADLAPAVASVKANYPSNVEGVKTFDSLNALETAFSHRIGYMNQYMRSSIATTGECETHVDKLYQGIHNPSIYYPTLKADGVEAKIVEKQIGDSAGILLMTSKALISTQLHEVCKAFNTGGNLNNLDGKTLKNIVASAKQSVMDTLNKLNDNYKNSLNDSNYLPELIASHMFALPPVVTFAKHDMGTVVSPLVAADTKAKDDENRKKFWGGFAKVLSTVATVLGIVAFISFLFPPVFPVVSGLAALTATLSLVGTAILVPVYTSEWLTERSNYRSLERSLLSGGNQEYGEQIASLVEFRQARFEAILAGAGVVLGAGPVAKFASNPRAVSLANRPGELAGKIWGQTKRPFQWSWSRVKDPGQIIRDIKNIPSASQAGLKKIGEGIDAVRARIAEIDFKKIKGVNITTAKNAISTFLKNSATSIKSHTLRIVKNNLNAWKADAGWLKLRALKKANKDVFKKVRFKMRFNTNAVNGGGTIDVINRAPYDSKSYDEIMGLVREVFPQKNAAWKLVYVNG